MGINIHATNDQREIIYCTARHVFMAAGRRYGKTIGVVRNRIIVRCAKPKFNYWYVTPSYSQCMEEFEALATHPALQHIIVRTKQQPFPQIYFGNGARVGYRSFKNPKELRSRGLDEVWIDEIQDIQERGFMAVIRALVADRRGTIGMSGQFRGYNWYYKKYFLPGQPGDKSRRPQIMSWRFPTSDGLMFQSAEGKAELEQIKSEVPPAVYEQEYECIPSANQFAVFSPKHVEQCRKSQPRGPQSGERYLCSVDIGKHADHTVVIVMANNGDVVHRERYPIGTEHAVAAKNAVMVAAKYRAAVLVDATGGGEGNRTAPDRPLKMYRELCHSTRLQYREMFWSYKNKERLIYQLAVELQQKLVSIPVEFDDVAGELLAYEYKFNNGIYQYSAPPGQWDDFVTALAIAVEGKNMGLATGGGQGLGSLSI